MINLFKYNISDNLDKLFSIETKCIVNTINPHSYVVSKKDKVFSDALVNSTVLIPDGIGITIAVKFLTGKSINRITGSDLHDYILNTINYKGGRVFYLGSSNSILEKISDKIQNQFLNIDVGYYSPPFENSFTNEENMKIIDTINQFLPDVTFVGMTAPKQEKWVWENYSAIESKIFASIGAVFDFYSGEKKRSGEKWRKYGLEWLPRLVREPRHLWKRSFISAPLYIKDVIVSKYYSSNNMLIK